MNLTSLNRLRSYMSEKNTVDNNVSQNRRMLTWISSVSARIEKYLNRNIKKDTYTQYFDSDPRRIEYFVNGTPISSITSVYEDATGLYNGNETQLSDSYIGKDNNSVVLDVPVEYKIPKGLRIIYQGGPPSL